MDDAMDGSYSEQQEVDSAFADYDTLRLSVRDRAMFGPGSAMLCVSCGSDVYTYNNRGSQEPGARICSSCGIVQPGCIIYEHMFGNSVPSRSSNYKRIHHWHERISQFMLMESQIPPHHMLAIGEKLLDGTYAAVSKDSVRQVLRSLGLQVYIEKWLQIIARCTSVRPPCPGPVLLQRLDALFIEMQRPFDASKAEGRRNFLNYNYVFCRLLQHMNCTKFCMFFPLIRSKPKLRALDETWLKMVQSIGWEPTPLQTVAPFSVRLESPDSLLLRLKQQCAASCLAVPRSVPARTAGRTSDPRAPKAALFERSQCRSERPEQRPQTLTLKLKRKRCMVE